MEYIMHALSSPAALPAAVDFDERLGQQFFFWADHPALHRWMETLYLDKGGKQRAFDNAAVALTEADLLRLESEIRAGKLPQIEGFYYDSQPEDRELQDLAFITFARREIALGRGVFYTGVRCR